MKRIAILGCENAHAATFLNFLRDDIKYGDVTVCGVYSDDAAAADRLAQTYGVKILPSFDAAAGAVDGVIVTARHGDSHYRFAAPYIADGVPMFIDKPITVRTDEAIAFMRACRDAGVRVTGGSCLKYDPFVRAAAEAGLPLVGGCVRAPISLQNAYGNFYFYAQHLVEPLLSVFGRRPRWVQAFTHSDKVIAVIRYEAYDVTALFVEENYVYHMTVHTADGAMAGQLNPDEACFRAEFDAFYRLLNGEKQELSYEDFIAPVFVMNAIVQSMETGLKTPVGAYTL